MRALASLGGKSLPPSNSDFSDRLLGRNSHFTAFLRRGVVEIQVKGIGFAINRSHCTLFRSLRQMPFHLNRSLLPACLIPKSAAASPATSRTKHLTNVLKRHT